MEVQAVLTMAFNIICIGYATLAAANFILGLMEEFNAQVLMQNTDTGKKSTVQKEDTQMAELPTDSCLYGWDYVGGLEDEIPESIATDDTQTTEISALTGENNMEGTQLTIFEFLGQGYADLHKELENQVVEVIDEELGQLSIRQLKARAKERHIPRYSNMRKDELIEALSR